MIIENITQDDKGRVHVMLANKRGVCFESRAVLNQTATDAIRTMSIEQKIAIAIARSVKASDAIGADLRTAIDVSYTR